jgi:hypothetical protein
MGTEPKGAKIRTFRTVSAIGRSFDELVAVRILKRRRRD